MIFYKILIYTFLFLFTKAKTTNNNDLAVIKFKTFFPKTSNMLEENYEFETIDFVKSIILSQTYFELEIGNEKNHQEGTSQILNTFTNTKDNSFSFVSSDDIYYPKDNNSLCHYNISLSNTNKYDDNTGTVEETFKIYSDISMSNYDYFALKLYNKNLNDSVCGKIGVDLMLPFSTDDTNFIPQILKHLETSDKSYAYKFSSNNRDEGVFLIGNITNNFVDLELNHSNLISFMSKSSAWEITMDSIILEGYNISSNKHYDFVSVSISPDYEGLAFSEYYIDYLNEIFFNKYIKQHICKIETVGSSPAFTIVSCDGSEFGKEDIKNFPKIIFTRYKLEFNITFEGEELFYLRDNRYYFKIYKIFGKSRQFIFGKLFLRKYFTIFNAEAKQISFYNSKMRNLGENLSNGSTVTKIIIIIFLVAILVFLGIGIFIGKYIYKTRRKHANELDDNYLYEAKDGEDETLYKGNKEDN